MRKILIMIMCLGILATVLTGCGNMMANSIGVPVVNPHDKSSVMTHVEKKFNSYKNITIVRGPLIFYDNNVFGNTYLVRGWFTPNGTRIKEIQVYVSAKFNDWAFLEHAYSNGRSFPVTVIDRDVISCSSSRYSSSCTCRETVGIMLPISMFDELSTDGFSFEVSGSHGAVSMTIPPEYFQGFRDAFFGL